MLDMLIFVMHKKKVELQFAETTNNLMSQTLGAKANKEGNEQLATAEMNASLLRQFLIYIN